MNTFRINGHVDANHQLVARVPESIPVGPVTVLLVHNSQEDDAGDEWMAGVAHQWADDLSDQRQDIYTRADGEPVRDS
jgi:hypothetical protein